MAYDLLIKNGRVIDGSGAIQDVNSREKSLLQTLRNPNRNAG